MADIAVNGQETRRTPLSVPGSQVSVSATATGFRVSVVSKNGDVARSIVDKGVALVGTSTAY